MNEVKIGLNEKSDREQIDQSAGWLDFGWGEV